MSTATLKQGTHTLTLIGQQDPSMEDLTILHDGYITDLVLAIKSGTIPPRVKFREFIGLGPLEFNFVVDYNQTLGQMINAGHYDWTNSYITAERFPVKGSGQKEITARLIHFDRVISSDDAEKELDKMGLHSGTSEELLAFGATFPDVQRQFPIIGLGSVAEIDGGRQVLYLGRSDAERCLSLDWRDYDWVVVCRFLAVPK